MKSKNEPCTCGNNRWKTVKKGLKWQCRKCGSIRDKK